MNKQEHIDKVAFGFWVYILSDCVLFAALFATYGALHGSTFAGPTPKEIFSLPYVFVETLILLTSSFVCGLAVLFAQAGNKKATLAALGTTLALGASFVGMELVEFRHLISEGHSWTQSAFLSSYFTLVGTHGLHIMVGILWVLVLCANIATRGLEKNMGRILTFSIFWHFLDIIWIFIFTFVYLFGTV